MNMNNKSGNLYPMDLAPKIALVKPNDSGGGGHAMATGAGLMVAGPAANKATAGAPQQQPNNATNNATHLPQTFRTIGPQGQMRVVMPSGTSGAQLIQTAHLMPPIIKQVDNNSIRAQITALPSTVVRPMSQTSITVTRSPTPNNHSAGAFGAAAGTLQRIAVSGGPATVTNLVARGSVTTGGMSVPLRSATPPSGAAGGSAPSATITNIPATFIRSAALPLRASSPGSSGGHWLSSALPEVHTSNATSPPVHLIRANLSSASGTNQRLVNSLNNANSTNSNNHQRTASGQPAINSNSSPHHQPSGQPQPTYVATISSAGNRQPQQLQHFTSIAGTTTTTMQQPQRLTVSGLPSATPTALLGNARPNVRPIQLTNATRLSTTSAGPTGITVSAGGVRVSTANLSIRTQQAQQLSGAGAHPNSSGASTTGPSVMGGRSASIQATNLTTGGSASAMPATRIIQVQQQPQSGTQLIGSGGRLAANVMLHSVPQTMLMNSSGQPIQAMRTAPSAANATTAAGKVQPSLTITHVANNKPNAGGQQPSIVATGGSQIVGLNHSGSGQPIIIGGQHLPVSGSVVPLTITSRSAVASSAQIVRTITAPSASVLPLSKQPLPASSIAEIVHQQQLAHSTAIGVQPQNVFLHTRSPSNSTTVVVSHNHVGHANHNNSAAASTSSGNPSTTGHNHVMASSSNHSTTYFYESVQASVAAPTSHANVLALTNSHPGNHLSAVSSAVSYSPYAVLPSSTTVVSSSAASANASSVSSSATQRAITPQQLHSIMSSAGGPTAGTASVRFSAHPLHVDTTSAAMNNSHPHSQPPQPQIITLQTHPMQLMNLQHQPTTITMQNAAGGPSAPPSGHVLLSKGHAAISLSATSTSASNPAATAPTPPATVAHLMHIGPALHKDGSSASPRTINATIMRKRDIDGNSKSAVKNLGPTLSQMSGPIAQQISAGLLAHSNSTVCSPSASSNSAMFLPHQQPHQQHFSDNSTQPNSRASTPASATYAPVMLSNASGVISLANAGAASALQQRMQPRSPRPGDGSSGSTTTSANSSPGVEHDEHTHKKNQHQYQLMQQQQQQLHQQQRGGIPEMALKVVEDLYKQQTAGDAFAAALARQPALSAVAAPHLAAGRTTTGHTTVAYLNGLGDEPPPLPSPRKKPRKQLIDRRTAGASALATPPYNSRTSTPHTSAASTPPPLPPPVPDSFATAAPTTAHPMPATFSVPHAVPSVDPCGVRLCDDRPTSSPSDVPASVIAAAKSAAAAAASAATGVRSNKENSIPAPTSVCTTIAVPTLPRKPRRLLDYKTTHKAPANHFARYTDVKPREERPPTVMDLANQASVLQKINGWKLFHLSAQMEDLSEVESQVYSKLTKMLSCMEAHQHSTDVDRVNELIKGNLQRSKIVSDVISESRGQIMKIFDHKAHVNDIIQRCASKRNFKKRDKP